MRQFDSVLVPVHTPLISGYEHDVYIVFNLSEYDAYVKSGNVKEDEYF